jgi:levanase/fructan beta-fructosidase
MGEKRNFAIENKTKNEMTMRKSILMLMVTVMVTLTQAQVIPTVLGDKHAMLKVRQGEKFLLLPVQESEDIAAIAVLNGQNDMVQRINVKLAIDRVDYYVPYELKGATLLDIEFHGDRRQKGAVGEFVCWKEMKYSNTFDTTNREKYRPAYHHTPLYGWMNDPNGMFYKDGVWHLYFQYNPYGSQWENMTWGHSTSRDLIHWDAQPMAIEMDWLGSIFSGSCVTNGDEVVAFYTSAGHHQTQSMAVSKDGGRTFMKYSGNPVLTTSDIPDFRDPKAFWNEDIKAWNLILAAGQEMRIYSSKDLKDWKYESSFGKEYGNHSGVWECPDLFEIKDEKLNIKKWVLICNINPGGPFGGSATQYFVGDFDGKKFTCESMPKVTKWLDYGKDHYATVSFYNAPENRRVVLAWMSNWQYANQVPTKQFRSANSIPRDLGLFTDGEESYVSVVPSKEMLALRGSKVKKPTEACEIIIDTKGPTEIVLSNTKGEQVVMKYDAQKQTFSMDRTKSGDVSFSEAFPCVTVAPTHGQIKQLRLFIDHCSIEAFDAEGKMAMTNLVFPSEPYNTIKVKGGKTTIYDIKH